MPTPTLEEYLETIYKLGLDGSVRPTRIAESIGVSGPTVTATLKRLEARGLVKREGTEVVLTEKGVSDSLNVVRKHRVAERFLVDVLGLDWEAAHEEACLLEHALSVRVVSALEALMDNPDVCPHGHPIPSATGTVANHAGIPLSEAGAGDRVKVLRVGEQNESLGYLGSMGLFPGAAVEVVSVEPAGGVMNVRVGGQAKVIALEVASYVTVTRAVS